MKKSRHPAEHERHFPDNATLMSTTDPSSHITYTNDAFVAVSGFSKEEMTGQAHNLVRHPDMPKEAFADMWATLKGGEPWTALVKNRSKDGGYYWVQANVIPVIREGRTRGYMSVRIKPSKEAVQAASELYEKMRQGTASVALRKGVLVRKGWTRLLSLGRTISVRNRIRLNMFVLWCLSVAGMSYVNQGLHLPSIAVLTTAFALGTHLFEQQFAKPIEQMRKHALDVATGNNRKIFQMNRVDEVGMTIRSINQLGLMFRWLVDDVNGQIMNLQQVVQDIATGNHDLNNRTARSAANLEQTAAFMEEMSGTVENNTSTSIKVADLSNQSTQQAQQGGESVQKVADVMSEIAERSQKMKDIIGTIDNIAFQTNILALNAAVEAARAGEQGRSFAVVANEVRTLASRCAEAAKEIKNLIEACATKIDDGNALVGESKAEITAVVEQVKAVSDLINEISSATREQRDGINQARQAVVDLETDTQQNAALVAKSADAATYLHERTQTLVNAVKAFS